MREEKTGLVLLHVVLLQPVSITVQATVNASIRQIFFMQTFRLQVRHTTTELSTLPKGEKYVHNLAPFLPRTIKDWNCLPREVVEATMLDTFVSRASY